MTWVGDLENIYYLPSTCSHAVLCPLVNADGVTVALECERCGETFEATS